MSNVGPPDQVVVAAAEKADPINGIIAEYFISNFVGLDN